MAHQFDVPTNRLYQIRDELLRKHIPLTDLISGNVNSQGIIFPLSCLQKAMAAGTRTSQIYRPNPLGQPVARQAIARFYAKAGLQIPIEQILLTPGTSMSYWYAFKLLADAGDEILAPVPSYPLFDSIAALCGVKLIPYRLREAARWEIDFSSMEAAITSRTKAIVLISPHNPTGAVATEEEVQVIADMATHRGLAIISDEVFSSFLFNRSTLPRPAMTKAPLVITMNGLSKMLALPGMKIGWMAISGEKARVRTATKTLEMISDTFLPVNEPAQFSLPEIFKGSTVFQKKYVAIVQNRMAMAMDSLKEILNVSFIRPEGGFFVTVRLVGEKADEEKATEYLLEKYRILVHPGYFYDMEGQHVVFSFVSRPGVLRSALKCLSKI